MRSRSKLPRGVCSSSGGEVGELVSERPDPDVLSVLYPAEDTSTLLGEEGEGVAAALFSNRVPSNAVFLNEPLLLRVLFCCCKAVAIAFPPRGLEPRLVVSPLSMPPEGAACVAVVWLMRRNESFENSVPDKLRRWPVVVVLLALLPDRARPDGAGPKSSPLLWSTDNPALG